MMWIQGSRKSKKSVVDHVKSAPIVAASHEIPEETQGFFKSRFNYL
jgi:hypothetical protein